jgi:hypothetical protein
MLAKSSPGGAVYNANPLVPVKGEQPSLVLESSVSFFVS